MIKKFPSELQLAENPICIIWWRDKTIEELKEKSAQMPKWSNTEIYHSLLNEFLEALGADVNTKQEGDKKKKVTPRNVANHDEV